jgi:integrase
VARLKWPEIDFKDKKVLFVSQQGASTKNRKSRPVPLPDHLIAALKKYQSNNGHTQFVFPNGQGGMEGHFLRILKNLAHRANLNCGHCKNVGRRNRTVKNTQSAGNESYIASARLSPAPTA